MKRSILAAVACAMAAIVPAIAHHSFAMFDKSKIVTIVGTVARYEWTNPHMHIGVVVAANKEGVAAGEWDVEGASINISAREGWTRNTFKAGDKITVEVHPLRDGTQGASLMFAVTPDGKKLYHDINRAAGGGPV
jgi:Family of unknown function (DUF6152)